MLKNIITYSFSDQLVSPLPFHLPHSFLLVPNLIPDSINHICMWSLIFGSLCNKRLFIDSIMSSLPTFPGATLVTSQSAFSCTRTPAWLGQKCHFSSCGCVLLLLLFTSCWSHIQFCFHVEPDCCLEFFLGSVHFKVQSLISGLVFINVVTLCVCVC